MAANSHRDIRKEGEEQQAKTMKDVAKFDRLSRWTISHLSGLANCQYRLLRTTPYYYSTTAPRRQQVASRKIQRPSAKRAVCRWY